jgi:Domain of unknown function (DUF4870)
MTYSPTVRERTYAAVTQAAAAIFLFVPCMIAIASSSGKTSPYVRYWARVCNFWCLSWTIVAVASVALSITTGLAGPIVVLATVHFMFCITGAVSAYFNTPFQYWFVARKFCVNDLIRIFGQLPDLPNHEE